MEKVCRMCERRLRDDDCNDICEDCALDRASQLDGAE